TINSYFSNNNWINRGKDENKYNNAGQISERKGYYWNANTSSWVYLNTITYTYNNGALTEKLDESPSFSSTRTIYTYNTDGTLAEELYQYLDGATWINSDRTLYFYDNTSAINKIEAKDIDVYPNPSTGMFTVDFNFDETPAQVLVMDIAGKQVFKQHINSGYTVEVNLQNLDKGIYLLQIAAAGKVDVKKIIVQ
ncbi:MAG TPA: T9SS type A sorting domain-containing protein, partial [Bacteroidia bacterium]|nr:T9SS type A sorting domain-containing protein [Bacteroidia bacterium]